MSELVANQIYRAALNIYGAAAQTVIVFEEMAELQKELCKHMRGANNREDIAEEIADVQIMLEQMIALHDCAETVQRQKAAKLQRLLYRLEEKGCDRMPPNA